MRFWAIFKLLAPLIYVIEQHWANFMCFGVEPIGLGNFHQSWAFSQTFVPVHGLFSDEDSDFCKMSCHSFLVLCSVSEIIDCIDFFTLSNGGHLGATAKLSKVYFKTCHSFRAFFDEIEVVTVTLCLAMP